jgi:hypothetical protein
MKVSSFTFIRNASHLGYPIVESIRSVLPICDEYVVNVGESEDNTLELIKSIGDPKIRILETKWNDKMKVKGFVYGQQKTIAHYSCTGDWAFYLEGDEVVHEDDLQNIYSAMEKNLDNPSVEAMVFDYIHFYRRQDTYIDSPGWYRRAPRIIRNSLRAYSPDGLFFVVLTSNKKGRYPNAVLANARIFHYGYLKSEDQWRTKICQVVHYWNQKPHDFSYADIDPAIIRKFSGTHPAIMKDWLSRNSSELILDPNYRLSRRDIRQRLKGKLEKAFNIDLSKKHFKLLER